jgi:hypothetical protein
MVSIRGIQRFAGGGLLVAALAAGGCASSAPDVDSGASPQVPALARADTAAATLRQRVDNLLQEHVSLASAATNAALAERHEEFTAASNALDKNTVELAAAIGSICGSDAQNTLLKMWRDQTGELVDYTLATVANDDDKKAKAKTDLIASANEIATYLETMTDGRLKKEVVAELIKGNIGILTEIISAQSAKDYATAYNKQRDAEHQILDIGDPLSDALVDQYPEKF